jgi:vacuolar-type H+-ATPase subunit E/Vma4
MPVDQENAEVKLQNQIYTALVELNLAEREAKKPIVESLVHASQQLHDLIVFGTPPIL